MHVQANKYRVNLALCSATSFLLGSFQHAKCLQILVHCALQIFCFSNLCTLDITISEADLLERRVAADLAVTVEINV